MINISMIYSINGIFYDLKFKNGNSLQNCKFEHDDIFYHHDFTNTKLYDFLEEVHWDHLRNNKNVKLLHVNCGETFREDSVLQIQQVVNSRKIDPSQIYILLMDTLHTDFLINELKKCNIVGVNIGIFSELIFKIVSPKDTVKSDQTHKKFSALSRNYKFSRLQLYLKLVQADLLDDFIYSFYNIDPYTNFTYGLDSILDELDRNKITINNKEKEWISKIPHVLQIEKKDEISNLVNKTWTTESYDSILCSDFHLIVETHFELKYLTSSVSEKTYKAIACGKPFLLVGIAGFLSDLRKLGFKTFSPFIDETYDTIVDNEQRRTAIVNEVERITKLNETEYLTLLDNCNTIAAENLRIFQEKKIKATNEDNFNAAFDFLKPYIKQYEFWNYPVVII